MIYNVVLCPFNTGITVSKLKGEPKHQESENTERNTEPTNVTVTHHSSNPNMPEEPTDIQTKNNATPNSENPTSTDTTSGIKLITIISKAI